MNTKILTQVTENTVVVDADPSIAKAFNELAEARLAVKAAKAREDAAKATILAALPERKLGVTYVVRVVGSIRGKVTAQTRRSADLNSLLLAFPEAYEAVVSDSKPFDVVR